MITTCTECGCLYEAGSEEQAHEEERYCPECFEEIIHSEPRGWYPTAENFKDTRK